MPYIETYKRNYMKKLFITFVALMAVLCSCGGSKSGETVKETLRIGVMPSVDHLPLAIAVDQHYYDTLGLEVELVRFTSPMERDAALQAGEIDATVSDYTTVMLQNQKGLPVQLLFATDGIFSFISSPTAGIKSIADLKGKKVGLSSNTVIEYATDKLLTEATLSPSDVTKVEVQKIPLRLEMIAKGELDAAVLPQPFAQIALDRGLTEIPGVLGVGEGQLHITALAVHSTNTKDKQQALSKLVMGYNKAVDYLNNNEIAKWVSIAAKELKVEPSVVERMSFGLFMPASSPQVQDVEAVAKWLQGKGLIPTTYTGNEAIMPLPASK